MTVSNPRRDDMRAAPSAADEPALLQRLREGDDAAFGELFELHAVAVRRLALGMASDRSEAEDITAETFFRVLQALRRGSGPRDNVRAYLLTVARRVCWEWHGARRDVPVSDDELTTRAGAGADSQARAAEHNLISRAFSSLPERWRSVLWQTEVEGEQPAVVAPHFGLSPNATAALARRARLGLRAAYLQAHLAVHRSSDGCRTVMEKLGGYTAGSVTGAEARKIRAHLIICPTCRSTHDELRDVCSTLRAHAGVVVLLVPASALAFGSGAGAGMSSLGSIGSSLSTAGAAGSAGAAGAVGSVGSGTAGGFAMAVGAKAKIGLALASTAAAGAFGVAVGPVVDNGPTQTIGLPGGGTAELSIAPSTATPIPRTSEVAGTGWRVPEVPGPSRTEQQDPPEAPGQQRANEYEAPRQLELPGKAEPDRTVIGGHELPGTSSAPEDRETSDSEPRIDKPDESTQDTTVLDTTSSGSGEPSTGPSDTSTNPVTPTIPITPSEKTTGQPGGGARATDETSAHDKPRPRDTIERSGDTPKDSDTTTDSGTARDDGESSSDGQARSDLESADTSRDSGEQARHPIIRIIVIHGFVADGDTRADAAGLDE